MREEIAHLDNQKGGSIEVMPFQSLLIDFAHQVNATVIVRGLRAVSDFDYEFQMASMNAKMAPDVETLCLMASDKYHFIASSLTFNQWVPGSSPGGRTILFKGLAGNG